MRAWRAKMKAKVVDWNRVTKEDQVELAKLRSDEYFYFHVKGFHPCGAQLKAIRERMRKIEEKYIKEVTRKI